MFSIVLLVLNEIEITRQCVSHIRHNSKQHIPILIIDNGSDAVYQNELRALGDFYFRNEENIGVIPAMNQAWKLLDTPYIMYLHNDLLILDQHFDSTINSLLSSIPHVGVAGFGGGNAADCQVGSRSGFTSNMINAEIFGTRMQQLYAPSVVLDGMCLIIRKDLIVQNDGIAKEYPIHHFYDMDTCLEAIYRGYKVITIGISIHHVGSKTSSRSDYTQWLGQLGHNEMTLYGQNQQIFTNKWGQKKDLHVDRYFNYIDAQGTVPMKV